MRRDSARIRAGQAENDDFVLCKLIVRLYINLAASTPSTPPSVTHRYHSHILSQPLLPSLVSLGRLFVVAVSDQPDPDDHTLLLDIVTLCRALHPPLVVGSEHSELISLVIDTSKRQDERLQQLSLTTLCDWARCSPRVLPFLSSRLHSTFPSLQLTALDVWLRLTTDCEDGGVLEAALDAVPLLVSLVASKSTEVGDRATTVLSNVAAHKEAREQMWRAKGFLKRIRLQLTGQTSPVAVVRLLKCMSLSPELADPMWKEGVVDDVLHLLHSTQQRSLHKRRMEEEKAQLEQHVFVEQQQNDQTSADVAVQSGIHRLLHNLVSVNVETDGADDDASNERWENRQWTILQSTVPDSVSATHRRIARRVVASPAFKCMLDAASLAPPTADAARLLATLIVALGNGPSSGRKEDSDNKPQAASESETLFATTASTVLPLLACLANSTRFEDQCAAASAYRCWAEASMAPSHDAASDARQCLMAELRESGSVHVVSTVAAALTALRRQDAAWQWHSGEEQLLANAFERWSARARRQQEAEEDVNDPSDELMVLTRLQQTLQQLMSNDTNPIDSASSAETPIAAAS